MTTASSQAVNQIRMFVEHLEKCRNAPTSSQSNKTDFYAHLASETGRSVAELESLRDEKLDFLNSKMSAILERIKKAPDQEVIYDFAEAFQVLASFYDNYSYLILPVHRELIGKHLDESQDILDKASAEIEGVSTVFDTPISNLEDSDLKEIFAKLEC